MSEELLNVYGEPLVPDTDEAGGVPPIMLNHASTLAFPWWLPEDVDFSDEQARDQSFFGLLSRLSDMLEDPDRTLAEWSDAVLSEMPFDSFEDEGGKLLEAGEVDRLIRALRGYEYAKRPAVLEHFNTEHAGANVEVRVWVNEQMVGHGELLDDDDGVIMWVGPTKFGDAPDDYDEIFCDICDQVLRWDSELEVEWS